ncbi:hypothetical protein [Treponema bryantii]|uniref:hypothetical protein n=1 Tax=Treponema bryantii TaxID=163 RepID=UPI002B2A6804|nr:hypothetical protein TRBR_24540 [Treponema bryantii]
MKKLLLCIILCAAFIPSLFANSDDFDEPKSEKIFAVVPGVRISILGLEPTIGFNIYNLDAELGVAISTGFTGEGFGVAPAISVGYCTNPFDKGPVATFGLEYLILTSSYVNLLNKVADEAAYMDIPAIHTLSLYYRGGFNFNNVFGLTWRVRLPLFMGGGGEYFNITNYQGALICTLAGICTISVGVKFTI